jgi:hypothetical protein
MTVDEVVAAGPSIVPTGPDGHRDPNSTGLALALLKTFYNLDGIPMTAYFLFDNNSRKLRFVTLKPTTSNQMDTIVASLARKYGESKEDGDPQGFIWAREWQASGDRVSFRKVGDGLSVTFAPMTCLDASYEGC